MNVSSLTKHRFFPAAVGAVVTAFWGLALWAMPSGESWANTSYDYLFRFSARAVTNKVVLVLMDNAARAEYRQAAGQPWDRRLHAQLLNKLTEDKCPLVVFDVFFEEPGEAETDRALAAAIQHHGRVVLGAQIDESMYHGSGIVKVQPIYKPFLEPAAGWGIARLDEQPVRRHWPFPAPQPSYQSLAWAAASRTGTPLGDEPTKQWLRYYGQRLEWAAMSYHFALSNTPGYFRDKLVFVGNKPATPAPGDEPDEFRTPYTRWTGEYVGGVEILATEFLNLLNGDWLRRPAWWLECLTLLLTGVLLGGGLTSARPLAAGLLVLGVMSVGTVAGLSWSYFTNYWFPWLVIVGGQAPLALVWALGCRWREATASRYQVAAEPFGKGAYGDVFLARDKKSREWVALKKVYRAKFDDGAPYEREFKGVARYLPVSSQHPGLLRVYALDRDEREGHFYYIMELGDAQSPGWETNPATFKPRDLASARDRAEGNRLPALECVRIGVALAEALHFLHQRDLIHRDIKPTNILFVRGQPKLADVGLVAEATATGPVTQVGTPPYMPPWPEPHGTRQADIYSLGMVLYEISTGQAPGAGAVTSIPTCLVGDSPFMRLNDIFCKACDPDLEQRYHSVAELLADLRALQSPRGQEAPTERT
ncbi:MAG TPA: CHASE2 domain-containing protein [Verrucomicrobiae bacterium]|nr:CHASE2 domain-containing protein [Verrucomicrobiae bacterium]